MGDQSGDVPDFFMTEMITVNAPEGRTVEIWNPLYKYDFKPVPSVGQGAFDGKVSRHMVMTEGSRLTCV